MIRLTLHRYLPINEPRDKWPISALKGELKEKLYNEINKEGLIEFHNKLKDLVDEYHPNIYLIDNIFKGIGTIERAILDELNK